jgi:hypothetical protein
MKPLNSTATYTGHASGDKSHIITKVMQFSLNTMWVFVKTKRVAKNFTVCHLHVKYVSEL